MSHCEKRFASQEFKQQKDSLLREILTKKLQTAEIKDPLSLYLIYTKLNEGALKDKFEKQLKEMLNVDFQEYIEMNFAISISKIATSGNGDLLMQQLQQIMNEPQNDFDQLIQQHFQAVYLHKSVGVFV